MARQFRVFAVSLLLACLFAFPAHATWSGTDSNNLSQIRNYTYYLQAYLPTISSNVGTIQSFVSSISNNLISYLDPSRYGSFSYQNLSKLDSITSLLKSISNTLGANSTIYPDNTAIYSFDDRYFFSSSSNDTYPGFIGFSNTQYIGFLQLPSAPLFGYLPPGDYTLVFNTSGPEIIQFGFETNGQNNESGYSKLYIDDFTDYGYVSGGKIRRFRCDFTVSDPDGLSFGSCTGVLSSVSSGYASGYIFQRADAAAILNDQVGADVDSHDQQLQQGVDQMEELENTAFGNLDTSIGSLDFSGSALGQIVSGFAFIRAVFSAVYSSSPYISVLINLSCMLGVLALFLRVQPRFSRWEREHRDRTS